MIKILLIQEWWFFFSPDHYLCEEGHAEDSLLVSLKLLGHLFLERFPNDCVIIFFFKNFFQIINVNNSYSSGVNMNNILSGGNINQDFMTVIWTNHPSTCPPNVLIYAFPQIIKSFRWIVDLKVLDHALHVEQEQLVLGDHKERQGDPEYCLYALR